MKMFLAVFATVVLAVNFAWAKCPSGHYSCGKGCAPSGTNCCEEYTKICPGDKPIACPKLGKCFRNHQDAEKAGCKHWIICGRPR